MRLQVQGMQQGQTAVTYVPLFPLKCPKQGDLQTFNFQRFFIGC